MQCTCFDILDGRYRIAPVTTEIIIFDMKPETCCHAARPFARIEAECHSAREAAMIVLEWLHAEGRIGEKEFQQGLSQLPPE